jgi:hypothetical protein
LRGLFYEICEMETRLDENTKKYATNGPNEEHAHNINAIIDKTKQAVSRVGSCISRRDVKIRDLVRPKRQEEITSVEFREVPNDGSQ